MNDKEALKLALKALEHCKEVIIERGLGGNPEFAQKWGLKLPLERAGDAITAIQQVLAAQPAPVAWGKPTDEMVRAATDEYDEWAAENKGTTECIRAILVKALKATPPAAQPAPVQPVVMTFDEAYASLSWQEWRMRPVKELLAELHRLTAPPQNHV
jgi:hypothetical protein